MATMELMCAMYGEATVFPVTVPHDARVCDLQSAIFRQKRYDQQNVDFDPSLLALHVARKRGSWLKDDADARALLRGEVDEEYTKMRPSWKLSDPEYFGEDCQPPKRAIHVLVKRKSGVGMADTNCEGSKSEQLEDTSERVAKRKRYCHSRVDTESGRQLLRALSIRVEISPTDSFRAGQDTSTPPFEWMDVLPEEPMADVKLSEGQRRYLYRTYVERNVGSVLAEKRLCVFGVERDSDILSVAVDDFDIELSGSTDLLVLSNVVEQNPVDVRFLPGVKMSIKVERDVSKDSVYQTFSELIALDLLAKGSVMALLTNLTDNWQFFWVSVMENTNIIIYKATLKTPGQAFQAIRTVLADSSRDGDSDTIRLPFIQEPVKRRKLASMLPTIAERCESSGALDAIEQYFDIASVLGPDVAMARSAARQIVHSIPNFSFHP